LQNAKDTFYEMLRGRIAVVNPERTVVVRGITRPGILVEENEFTTAVHPPDCFRLRWTETSVDPEGAMPAVTMQCVIDYETAGSVNGGRMDRGRALTAMDGELLASLDITSQNAQKANYSGLPAGNPVVSMNTNIWWGPPQFGSAELKDDRLVRSATIAVMSYQEAGEL
jgi:hypothetical protein